MNESDHSEALKASLRKLYDVKGSTDMLSLELEEWIQEQEQPFQVETTDATLSDMLKFLTQSNEQVKVTEKILEKLNDQNASLMVHLPGIYDAINEINNLREKVTNVGRMIENMPKF